MYDPSIIVVTTHMVTTIILGSYSVYILFNTNLWQSDSDFISMLIFLEGDKGAGADLGNHVSTKDDPSPIYNVNN